MTTAKKGPIWVKAMQKGYYGLTPGTHRQIEEGEYFQIASMENFSDFDRRETMPDGKGGTMPRPAGWMRLVPEDKVRRMLDRAKNINYEPGAEPGKAANEDEDFTASGEAAEKGPEQELSQERAGTGDDDDKEIEPGAREIEDPIAGGPEKPEPKEAVHETVRDKRKERAAKLKPEKKPARGGSHRRDRGPVPD